MNLKTNEYFLVFIIITGFPVYYKVNLHKQELFILL